MGLLGKRANKEEHRIGTFEITLDDIVQVFDLKWSYDIIPSSMHHHEIISYTIVHMLHDFPFNNIYLNFTEKGPSFFSFDSFPKINGIINLLRNMPLEFTTFVIRSDVCTRVSVELFSQACASILKMISKGFQVHGFFTFAEEDWCPVCLTKFDEKEESDSYEFMFRRTGVMWCNDKTVSKQHGICIVCCGETMLSHAKPGESFKCGTCRGDAGSPKNFYTSEESLNIALWDDMPFKWKINQQRRPITVVKPENSLGKTMKKLLTISCALPKTTNNWYYEEEDRLFAQQLREMGPQTPQSPYLIRQQAPHSPDLLASFFSSTREQNTEIPHHIEIQQRRQNQRPRSLSSTSSEASEQVNRQRQIIAEFVDFPNFASSQGLQRQSSDGLIRPYLRERRNAVADIEGRLETPPNLQQNVTQNERIDSPVEMISSFDEVL